MVTRLIELPSCEALEVRPADGGQVVLVPMVKAAVRRVAPAQRRIEVNLEFLGLSGRADSVSVQRDEPTRQCDEHGGGAGA